MLFPGDPVVPSIVVSRQAAERYAQLSALPKPSKPVSKRLALFLHLKTA